jgi:hypothetical protein
MKEGTYSCHDLLGYNTVLCYDADVSDEQAAFTLKIQVARYSEMLVSHHITTWCHNPGESSSA